MKIVLGTLRIIAYLAVMNGVLYVSHLIIGPRQPVLPQQSNTVDLRKFISDFNAQRQLVESWQRRPGWHSPLPGLQPEAAKSGEAGSKEAHP
jgi:hypothetical protein